jgi:hypothetical protein
MNDDTNGERTDIERGVNERMRELGRRSGEARRRNAKAKQTDELELTDREQAMRALRRALDGCNMAAMVAAAKALLEFDKTEPHGQMDVADARAELDRRLDQIEEHRRLAGEACQACGGRSYVPRAGAGAGAGGPQIAPATTARRRPRSGEVVSLHELKRRAEVADKIT